MNRRIQQHWIPLRRRDIATALGTVGVEIDETDLEGVAGYLELTVAYEQNPRQMEPGKPGEPVPDLR